MRWSRKSNKDREYSIDYTKKICATDFIASSTFLRYNSTKRVTIIRIERS